jgi:hypothetical protein
MRYKIEDIESIGRAYGSQLSKAGINAADDLLKHCCSAKGRHKVAAASGLDGGLDRSGQEHGADDFALTARVHFGRR